MKSVAAMPHTRIGHRSPSAACFGAGPNSERHASRIARFRCEVASETVGEWHRS